MSNSRVAVSFQEETVKTRHDKAIVSTMAATGFYHISDQIRDGRFGV
jgi:hypothetical protein